LLFVPATRPERFAKAFESGADSIIIDLEDAVAEGSKDSARDGLAQQLPQMSPEKRKRTLVRVNAANTRWHDDDITLLRNWSAHGVAVMLPKSENANMLVTLAQALGPDAQIVALVESLAGLDALDQIARAPQVVRLAFGHLDFQLDLCMRCTPDEPELNFARYALVAASRRASLPAPIDGVTVDIGNAQRLAFDAQRARAFGFGGKLCIHPSQVEAINQAMSYTEIERVWARRVLDLATHHGGAAFSMEGRMVDLPVIRLAQSILAIE
jgi:citrate lyase subunit beta/citryl-CoA lyase